MSPKDRSAQGAGAGDAGTLPGPASSGAFGRVVEGVNPPPRPRFWQRIGLRRTLLLILLPSMLAVAAGEVWLTWRTAVGAANAAYDRSLFGAIKSIDANISTASGGIGVELPYRLLEFFELTANGEVYFRVATDDGLVELGNTDLPPPPLPLDTGRPQFHDAEYFGERVRIGSYARRLAAPNGDVEGEGRIIIQVAESVTSRNDFTRALVTEAVSRDLLLIFIGAVLLMLLIGWALRPLQRLRSEVLARRPDDLAPIDNSGVPREVMPLVDAINHHVLRSRELAEEHRRFVDDASHQLRTPLATLAAQLAYTLREPDPARVRDAMRAIKTQLDDTVHRTNQMLALARTDTADVDVSPVDLTALAEGVTRECWSEAREKQIDLGFEPSRQPTVVRGHDALLREALRNLLHNALKFTPVEGHVTVRVDRDPVYAEVSVCDDGPGIPADERARAGERFFRASNVSAPGSGLGMAIVRSVAARLGGRMEVMAGPDDRGCRVSMRLPLWPKAEQEAAGAKV
jgi:two-component system, OmpR family, sensor histidine kinase TctE